MKHVNAHFYKSVDVSARFEILTSKTKNRDVPFSELVLVCH